MRQNGISDMLQVNDIDNGNSSSLINLANGNNTVQPITAPPVPPRSVNNNGDHYRLVLQDTYTLFFYNCQDNSNPQIVILYLYYYLL